MNSFHVFVCCGCGCKARFVIIRNTECQPEIVHPNWDKPFPFTNEEIPAVLEYLAGWVKRGGEIKSIQMKVVK
jgi:hypothetical protein